MPHRETTAAGAPCWTDLSTTDLPRAKKYYTEQFGWAFDESGGEEYGGYTSAMLDGQLVAGLMPHMAEMGGVPNVWTVYLKSEDAEATAAAVADAGGQVIVPPMHVAPYGHMAVFLDPGQAAIGAWQPETHQGFGIEDEHGAPVWHEVYSRAYANTVRFYQKAFGWKTEVMSDTDEFRYTTLGKGDAAKAGIMEGWQILPEGVPSHWVNYWKVDDADAACAKALKLGGKVIRQPEDSPFGRLATLADCCGAVFKIMSR
jgi:predicted enzyme related to lactoylglutathione lyase